MRFEWVLYPLELDEEVLERRGDRRDDLGDVDRPTQLGAVDPDLVGREDRDALELRRVKYLGRDWVVRDLGLNRAGVIGELLALGLGHSLALGRSQDVFAGGSTELGAASVGGQVERPERLAAEGADPVVEAAHSSSAPGPGGIPS
jgi:hypothetical protein